MQGNYTPDVANTLAATEMKAYVMAGGTAGAGSDIAETVIGTIGPTAGMVIGKVIITSAGTLTASDTLYVTFTIAKRTAAGSPVTIATATTKTTGGGGTGNWVAWTPVSIPVSAGATVAANDVITITATHASTGTAVPASMIEIFMGVS